MWRDQNRCCDIICLKDNEMVDGTFLSYIRPGSCQCTYHAHQNKQEKNFAGNFLCQVAIGLLASAGTTFQVHYQTSSPASRLIGRNHYLYRIPVTHAKLEGKSWHSCLMYAERCKHQARKTVKKCTMMYCWKCNVGLCTGQCFQVYHTKLYYWE